ncbi:MAG: hypothetical protein CM15mP62_30280 [Rhodospirillaceae bacterium]|nr:MAG: hypothetical protein CM15mP62_30280 [Rhodospirillaceae bacterium]
MKLATKVNLWSSKLCGLDKNRRLIADNCEGKRFVSGLLAAGYQVARQKGFDGRAGGAARAIAFSFRTLVYLI